MHLFIKGWQPTAYLNHCAVLKLGAVRGELFHFRNKNNSPASRDQTFCKLTAGASMTRESTDVATLRRYTKPRLTQISTTQVLLELIEQAEKDDRLAAHLKLSIHQANPDYRED